MNAASRLASGGLLLAFLTLSAGCVSTNAAFQYLPERKYYRTFEQFQPVEVRHVKHVRRRLWGVHMLGFQVKRPDVRAAVDAALEGNPSYYVSDLNIHTEIHGTILFVFFAGAMYLPRVTVDLDVVEVHPWAQETPPRAAGG